MINLINMTPIATDDTGLFIFKLYYRLLTQKSIKC